MVETTTIVRAYRYRLLPNEEQEATLKQWCAAVRAVYNAALEQRKLYGRPVGTDPHYRDCSFSAYRQSYEVKFREWKKDPDLEWLTSVPSDSVHKALGDLHQSYQNFFQGRASFPSWRRYGENESLRLPTFKISKGFPRGFHMNVVYGKRAVTIPKIGRINYVKHKQFRGRPTTSTIIYDAGKWFVSVACEITINKPDSSLGKPAVGLDVGVAKPVTLSDGTFHLPDKGLLMLDKRKRKLQRNLARCKKGSARRLRRRIKVSKISRHIADRRKAKNHAITTDLTRRFSTIVIEDLKISNMTRSAKGTAKKHGKNVKAKSGLNRAILNVAPYQFRNQLEYKILSTGGEIISVDPKFTSQTCNVCGVVDSKSRKSQDRFKCTSCGYEENADINAARVILARGLNLGSVSGPLKTPSELRRSRKTQKPATSKPHVSQSLVGVTQQNRGAKTSKIEGKTDA
jgi:putative transposase